MAHEQDEAVETPIRLWVRRLEAMLDGLRHSLVQLKDSGLGRRPPESQLAQCSMGALIARKEHRSIISAYTDYYRGHAG